jgi:chemotaxis protein CheX
MTEKIIAIDCSPQVVNVLSGLFGPDITLENGSFSKNLDVKGYRMIIIQETIPQSELLTRIRDLRYACCFKNIPIVLIKIRDDAGAIESFIAAGATEVLSLKDPQLAWKQILNGHLIPNRQPLEEEMEYINSFVKSTCNIFKTTASLDATFEEVYFTNDFKIFGDISGLIALTGGAEGILGVTFYWRLAQMIIAKIMGVEEDKINAELIHDGVAEIVNMISGSTKKDFVGHPYHFEISLPSVIVGGGHQLGHPGNTSIAVLIFKIESQYFALQVCLRPSKNGKGMAE